MSAPPADPRLRAALDLYAQAVAECVLREIREEQAALALSETEDQVAA